MANNPKRTNAAATLAADAICGTPANNGYLRIYDGTQPATADTAITTQTLLAELRLNADAFAAAVNGVATANAVTADSANNATGTATWFRVLQSDGTTVLWDGSVGTSGADLNINSVALQVGAETSVTSFTFTESLG